MSTDAERREGAEVWFVTERDEDGEPTAYVQLHPLDLIFVDRTRTSTGQAGTNP